MFKPIEAKLYSAIEKFLCLFTDLLIFESNYTANSFDEKFGCKRVKKIVNYNGVEIPVKSTFNKIKTTSSSSKRIGVFGLMREVKGQHLALDSIAELLEEGHDLELHFFGDGPLKASLEEKVRLLGYESNVIFHGEVGDVPYWLNTVDFVLIPSLFESFGYIAIEAIFSGKTVISSNVGGLSEILDEDFAFLFKVGCKNSMKKQICVATNTPSCEISRMNELALNNSKGKFEITSMLQGLKSKYGSLCEY
jgi:glycosyltransferase involved in cell wall biosynthesis